jgi:hypothetical protein
MNWFLVVLFFSCVAVGCSFLWVPRSIPFDSVTWKEQPSQRTRMVKDLLTQHHVEDASRKEIEDMLGAPTGRDSIRDDLYIYWAGHNLIDDMWLEVRFKNGTVDTVEYASD